MGYFQRLDTELSIKHRKWTDWINKGCNVGDQAFTWIPRGEEEDVLMPNGEIKKVRLPKKATQVTFCPGYWEDTLRREGLAGPMPFYKRLGEWMRRRDDEIPINESAETDFPTIILHELTHTNRVWGGAVIDHKYGWDRCRTLANERKSAEDDIPQHNADSIMFYAHAIGLMDGMVLGKDRMFVRDDGSFYPPLPGQRMLRGRAPRSEINSTLCSV
ncbi:hypothetical protein NA57DRAFT_56468 [Rhizodiscina lignyota]|uniref:Lysine-specific metallo-endopeptidase domain-containing protein n=1 Tax=Rhizodiscina lignyota TaxID=1504668 RepID=A0A9P4M6F6_9PEZI|nr:hypothetical protein NA57DRAFT_56468 [Rhizodiscina lignyota]